MGKTNLNKRKDDCRGHWKKFCMECGSKGDRQDTREEGKDQLLRALKDFKGGRNTHISRSHAEHLQRME